MVISALSLRRCAYALIALVLISAMLLVWSAL